MNRTSPPLRRPVRPVAALGAMALLLVASVVTVTSRPTAPASPPSGASIPPHAMQRLAERPIAFVENRGQWNEAVRFTASRGDLRAAFTADGVTLNRARRTGDRMRGAVVRLHFENAAANAPVVGERSLPGTHNFLCGDDATRWTTGVRAFAKIRYRNLYEGVDICFREQAGLLEYDVELAPGADPAQVVIRCDGADSLRLDADGALVVETPAGEIRQKPPVTWQLTASGERRSVRCVYRILDDRRYGFDPLDREPGLAMVIDPGIQWSTFLGGSDYDFVHDLAIDRTTGALTLCGHTQSRNFPLTTGAYDRYLGGRVDAFVTRIDARGQLVFSTYFGGRSTDYAKALVTTSNGDVVLLGYTESTDFATTTGGYDQTYNGGGDFFVTRFNATGSALTYSTYLGGTKFDEPHDLALDAAGAPVVVGLTQSTDFPTSAGAWDRVFSGGGGDGAVAKLDAAAAKLVFGTYLGGTGQDAAWAVGLTATGEPTVAGATWGVNNTTDFPTTPGAYDRTYNGGKNDAFVARLNGTATTLQFSTLLGGPNSDPIRDLHQHANGEVTVAGQTYSPTFPTTPGAYATTNGGKGDVFVLRLSGSGSTVNFGTFVGGSDYDEGTGLAVDASGAVTVTGWTRSLDFPTTPGCYQTTNRGNGDAFVFRLSPKGNRLYYATYVGGTGWDYPKAIGLDATNDAVIAGEVWSANYPVTAGVPGPTYGNQGDGFATRLDLLPTGAAKLGVSTPACRGPITLAVDRSPRSPEPAFGFVNLNAPPNSAGLLVLGVGSAPNGFLVDKATVFISPLHPFMLLPILSDGNGSSTPKVGIPAGVKGIQFYAQMVWSNTTSCPGNGSVSTSNALHLTFQ